MVPRAVGQRYASALFALANESSRMEATQQELHAVRAILHEHPTLTRALQAPTLPAVVKKDVLKRLFGDTVSLTILNFLDLLVDKQRESIIPTVVEEYDRMVEMATKSIRAEVTTAVDFPPNFRKEIQSRLSEREGKDVAITWKTDKSLVGGFIVRIEDRLYDSSLRSQLEELQERLQG